MDSSRARSPFRSPHAAALVAPEPSRPRASRIRSSGLLLPISLSRLSTAKKRVSLEDAKGKVTIVDFWATWCEPCRESFTAYQRILEKNASEIEIIGVSVDDAPDEIAAFASATGVKFPLAWDDGQAVAGSYKPPTMPTSYIIDQNGVVRYVHVGFKSGDDKEIEKEVVSLLK